MSEPLTPACESSDVMSGIGFLRMMLVTMDSESESRDKSDGAMIIDVGNIDTTMRIESMT